MGFAPRRQDVDPAEFRNGAQWAKVKGDSRYLTEDEKDKASIPATALNDTPLLLALKVEDEEAAALLLDAGADVARGDADGVTPLLQALEEGMRARRLRNRRALDPAIALRCRKNKNVAQKQRAPSSAAGKSALN